MTGPSSKLMQSVKETLPVNLGDLLQLIEIQICHVISGQLVQQAFFALLFCQDLDDFELRIRREEHLFLTGNGREMSNVLGSHRFNDKN